MHCIKVVIKKVKTFCFTSVHALIHVVNKVIMGLGKTIWVVRVHIVASNDKMLFNIFYHHTF